MLNLLMVILLHVYLKLNATEIEEGKLVSVCWKKTFLSFSFQTQEVGVFFFFLILEKLFVLLLKMVSK